MSADKSGSKPVEQVEMAMAEGETAAMAGAKLRLEPMMRHATVANAMAEGTVKLGGPAVTALESTTALTLMAEQVKSGDLGPVSDYLLAQAVMLDSSITELMRRAWKNAGEYPEAFRSYMGLALKAQAQSRSTLEALARMHQPREQIVRHVHVYEGGQAVVAEQLHMNGPGVPNAGRADQSHTLGAPGAALPSPDPFGNGMPIPSGPREAEMQDARRDKPRRTSGKRSRAQARAADA